MVTKNQKYTTDFKKTKRIQHHQTHPKGNIERTSLNRKEESIGKKNTTVENFIS